jgi:hypothetical protein
MKSGQEDESEILPSAEELLKLTSRKGVGDFTSLPSRDAFLNLGELADAAAKDFDWRKMSARLEKEILTEPRREKVIPRRLVQRVGSHRVMAWISVCSAAVLLVGFYMAVLGKPHTQLGTGTTVFQPPPRASGIDAWERSSLERDPTLTWEDELDLELAATRRALKQGRDPWMGDEPVLSDVYAQVNELSAGLLLEPF